MPAVNKTELVGKIADLRKQIEAGKIGKLTIEQMADRLAVAVEDVMGWVAVAELQKTPGSAVTIASADGLAVIQAISDGTISINVPRDLAAILICGLLHNPTANMAIVQPATAPPPKGVQ